MSKNKKETKRIAADAAKGNTQFVFGKENYKWMIIGLIVIALGFVLMYGKTDDIFSTSEGLKNGSFSFSTHLKITLAPIVVLTGFIIEIVAIMKQPKPMNGSN